MWQPPILALAAILYVMWVVPLTRRTLREPLHHTGTDFTQLAECPRICGCRGAAVAGGLSPNVATAAGGVPEHRGSI